MVKSLYWRGYERQEILELFRFIDWLLALPEGLEERLWNEVKAYEEGEKIPYATSVERIVIRKGHQKCHQEGKQEGQRIEAKQLLHRLLTRRSGPLPEWVEAKLNQADTATLENWAECLLFVGKIEDIFKEE